MHSAIGDINVVGRIKYTLALRMWQLECNYLLIFYILLFFVNSLFNVKCAKVELNFIRIYRYLILAHTPAFFNLASNSKCTTDYRILTVWISTDIKCLINSLKINTVTVVVWYGRIRAKALRSFQTREWIRQGNNLSLLICSSLTGTLISSQHEDIIVLRWCTTNMDLPGRHFHRNR